MPGWRLISALMLLNAVTGTMLGAQTRSRAFLELMFGGTTLVGQEPFHGEYYKQNTNALLLLTFGLQPNTGRALVTSLELGFLGIPLGDDSCRITPLGGCAAGYPTTGVIAALAGVRPLTSPWRFVELTAGPALIGQSGKGTPIGAVAKARTGSPPGTYLSPGIALYGIAKVVDGGLLFGVGAGVGFRTW